MPIPDNLRPISRFSMREEVYNTLLEWIMEGVLRPGEKILDKDLAEKMGVSRTPVREAMRRLEDKQLVESAANRWTRVAEIAIEEPEMIYPIIWTLEELAIGSAFPRLAATDLEVMKAANADLENALVENDPVRASRADARFHGVFMTRSENPFLINIVNDLKIRCRRIEVAYFGGSALAQDSVNEHNLILDALQVGNLTEVQRVVGTNWQNSLKRLRTIIKDQADTERQPESILQL
ncbi:MAG: GntR family transcriptional regulator [Desulfuromonadales bacterium]|nr:GntR family transcriptional regulator [Desulfuromonadales bacterium]MBN2793658.1 GntR family transcriptional regulator [Desulfuromonadales bacterium]